MVGAGFDDTFLKRWHREFDDIEQKSSPFADFKGSDNGKNHCLEPKFVGQFGFTEWTESNKLRHPRFWECAMIKKQRKYMKKNPHENRWNRNNAPGQADLPG
jgi:ATP-dependent DNA ligase